MKKFLKKSLSILLVTIILLSSASVGVITFVKAADDTITWRFDGENLVVSGSGELSSTYTSTEEWQNMRDKCVNLTVEGDITIIGKNSFRDFTALKTATVTSPLITVDEYAFSGCTALEDITLPDTLLTIEQYAFADCSAVKAFEFPSKLREISAWAFKNFTCFDGKALVLPDSLKKVSLGSFHGADITSLTAPFVGYGIFGNMEDSKGSDNIGTMFGDVQLPNTYACRYKNNYQSENYYIPNSLKEVTVTKNLYAYNFQNAKMIEKITVKDTVEDTGIPDCFAKDCQSLRAVVFENSDRIKIIGSSAFEGCSALKAFTIPQNVTKIYSRAFAMCVFDSIELPEKLEIIGSYAFYKCVNVESVVIPENVTSIEDYAFNGCTNLKEVKLPGSYYSFGVGVFGGTQYMGEGEDFIITDDGALVAYCGDDTEVVVPEGVTRIGSAFSGRSDIKSIVLPDGLLYISKNAFKGCRGLKELTIPDTVLIIESNAFYQCCYIEELVIPDSVVEIQAGAFKKMCGLKKLTVPFVGKNRQIETGKESRLGYWFDSYAGYQSCNCLNSSPKYIQQVDKDGGYLGEVLAPTNLSDLTVNGGVLREYSLNNFQLDVLTLGKSVEGIEEYAADKSGIKELHIDPDIKITEIPDYAFTNNNLTSVTIPGCIKRIGKAFICNDFTKNKITEINLGEGVEIVDGSFAGAKITSIDFPDSLKKILDRSFYNCSELKSVEFPENLSTIGTEAFCYCVKLEQVSLNEKITRLNNSAFYGCPIKKVVVPEGIAGIVSKTFCECEKLEVVVIGGDVEVIGPRAFADCPSLESVIIPDSVVSISDDAFENSNEDMVIYCNEGSYAQQYASVNNIKYTTLVLDAIPNQTYTGKEIEPDVKAKANNRDLALNSEYTVSFSDNIDVGVASVTARGLGDFKHLIAKGRFNILARPLSKVAIDYDSFTYYSPSGIKPNLTLTVDGAILSEGKDYEIVGLDKITAVGTYNIAIKGTGNLSGTKNLTLEVLPRSIKKANVSFEGTVVEVTDSKHTLVEGVDYKLEKRNTESGELETYVVGIGNYTEETRVKSTGDDFETNLLYRLFAFFEKILAVLRGIFN